MPTESQEAGSTVRTAIGGQPSATPSLTTHAMWLLVAKSVGFCLSVALPLVLVRRMSQEEFGLYKQAFFIVNIAMNVLPLGFGMSAFYFLPRERERQGSVVVNILLFHAAMGVLVSILLMLWPGLLPHVFNSPDLAPLAGLIGVVVLLWTFASFLEIVTVAARDVGAATGFIVVSQFSKTLMLIIAAAAVGTVRSLVIAAIVQGLAQMAMMVAYLRIRFPGFWRGFNWRLFRTQAAYALPLGFSALVVRFQEDLHHLFVSNAFGPVAYAVYSVGVFKLPLVGILRESAGSVALPRINELEKDHESRRILQLVAAGARKLSLVYFPLYVFLMITGREVIALLFTDQYISSWPVFAIAMTLVPFGVLMLEPITRAHHERYFFLRLRLVLFTILTTVLWFGAERLGLVGIISAVVSASLIAWGIAAFKMVRLLDVRRRDLALFADVGRIAASSVVAGLVCLWVRHLLLSGPAWPIVVICGPIFVVAYAGAIGWAGVIKPDEYRMLWHEAQRVWLMIRRRATSRVTASAAPPHVHPTAPV